ncbi:hypothetical protein [Streptodolium elevatio]
MRNTDPFDFFQKHRDIIFRWSAILGIALVVFLIVRFFAMRLGGWRAAWRRLCREVALTAYAFSAPVRSWIRHRQSARRLVLALGAHASWRDAEQALKDARSAAAPAQPYAVYVDAASVTVLFAARDMPPASGIWQTDQEDPAAWTAPRTALPPVTADAGGVRPIVVALGEAGQSCVFLDLAIGPPTVAVEGEQRSRNALFQAVAAQVDARLPAPQAVIAEGVHADFAGEPVRAAYRTALATPPRLGIPAFLITAALPDPLPPELAEPPREVTEMRILLRGPGRGYVRTLLTDRHGRAAVPGTPLLVTCHALGAALAKVLPHIPPVLPPAPDPNADLGIAGADLFEEVVATARTKAPDAAGAAPAVADLFEETYEIGQTAEGPEVVVTATGTRELFEEAGETAGTRTGGEYVRLADVWEPTEAAAPAPTMAADYPPPTGDPVDFLPPPSGMPFASFPPPGEYSSGPGPGPRAGAAAGSEPEPETEARPEPERAREPASRPAPRAPDDEEEESPPPAVSAADLAPEPSNGSSVARSRSSAGPGAGSPRP